MSRQTAIVAFCLAAVTILAWAYLVHLDRQMTATATDETAMAAMGMAMRAPWTWADVLFMFGMWTVMMVGMMVPSASPILLLAARAPRTGGERFNMALWFGAGYLLVWIGFSAVAAMAQWGLHAAALLSPAMASNRPRLSGAILVGAGAYQFTSLKQSCLTHCRSPLDFLVAHWRSGRYGALRTGASHGVYCLGCCWALMGVLFVVGVMNLVWVAALAVFVLVEKAAPAAASASRIAGAALIIAGAIKLVLNA